MERGGRLHGGGGCAEVRGLGYSKKFGKILMGLTTGFNFLDF